MALSAFVNILLVSSACAIALLVCIGVHDCGLPSSASVWHTKKTAVSALMNRAPNSASTADEMTARIICKILTIYDQAKGVLLDSELSLSQYPGFFCICWSVRHG